jgi:DNA-binding MarR family transcriptional regulator
LRWLSVLADKKLIERKEDPADGRRVFVELTDDAFAAMARYFKSLDGDDAPSE